MHYLIIIGILVLGASLTLFFAPNKGMQFLVVLFTACLYLVYGIVHHYFEHTLTIKIVIEYILIALLVITLFVFIKGGML